MNQARKASDIDDVLGDFIDVANESEPNDDVLEVVCDLMDRKEEER